MTRWWYQVFLEKRSSVSLGLFRLAVAWTVGCHMIPSFFHMDDNYLSTAFKTKNLSFFPIPILQLVERSPDWLVWVLVGLFLIALTSFAVGLFSRASCLLMTLCCYYFYALNNFHIGTLSFDILLVTLFLMCVTNYHGDFLSLDSLRRAKATSYKRPRPFFIQRLLQLQLAVTFWHTALNKTHFAPPGAPLPGNWLTDNPYYYLMHYPPIGVVREFPWREFLGQHPQLCYALGIACISCEILMPLLWFIPRTRAVGITLGICFQLMLWVTLHVPTIFLFLFPPMMLLFIAPETLVRRIETQQERSAVLDRAILVYDGQCGFCLESIRRLRVLDLFGWIDPVDFHAQPDVSHVHPSLTSERCRSEMVLVEVGGQISGGFDAFRRMSWHLPMCWPLVPWLYLPGARWVGARVYRWIAKHRDLFHRNPTCASNQCGIRHSGNGS